MKNFSAYICFYEILHVWKYNISMRDFQTQDMRIDCHFTFSPVVCLSDCLPMPASAFVKFHRQFNMEKMAFLSLYLFINEVE